MPNPLMPAAIRLAHLFEVVPSIFAFAAVLALGADAATPSGAGQRAGHAVLIRHTRPVTGVFWAGTPHVRGGSDDRPQPGRYASAFSVHPGRGRRRPALRAGRVRRELARTPRQTEGPFYPNKLPLDTDNDLIVINDGITPAVGEITHLTGRILDAKGDAGPQRASSRSGSATPTASTCTPGSERRRQAATRTSRASAGSSPARPASTTSARSSRCPTPAARRTSTSRSRRAARSC